MAGAFLRMVGPSAWKGPRMPLFVIAAFTAPETVVNAAAHPDKTFHQALMTATA